MPALSALSRVWVGATGRTVINNVLIVYVESVCCLSVFSANAEGKFYIGSECVCVLKSLSREDSFWTYFVAFSKRINQAKYFTIVFKLHPVI